ncbi:MAG: hypothetical protein JST81_13625 [Bacteroidetes bacterium]|nr:hypothetical protein [Bacteroidota bacterium]
MKILPKVVICLLIFQSLNVLSYSQINTAQQILSDMYKSYDSLNYLTFDVSYNYNTDTLYGDFTQDKLNGTYTLNGKKAFYKLGDIDFMQNEDYLVAVYHKEKFIIVSDPQQSNAGGYLPMRAQMDSMFQLASAHYNVNVSTTHVSVPGDSAHTISSIIFTATDSQVAITNYVIKCDMSRHVLKSLEYVYLGNSDNNDAYETLSDSLRRSIMSTPRRKRLAITFSNYRFDNLKKEIYDVNNYVFFEDKVCKPVTKYADFKVYNNSRRR